jgi:16S rRNA (guanine527-N7)-methyltransferase
MRAELEGSKYLESLELPEEALVRLRLLAGLVTEWNGKVNLISRADVANIWTAHILHSLSPLFHYSMSSALNVLDLGTGGGFPGLPLAIARPDSVFTLVDATGKKVKAVEDMAGRLGLHNVRTLHARAEDLARNTAFANRFDVVTARAVAPLPDLIGWSRPLVRRPGPAGEGDPPVPVLLAYKGGDIEQEIAASIVKNNSTKIRVIDLVFPPPTGLVGKRLVVVSL